MLAALAFAACSEPPAPAPRAAARVLIVGGDGLEWTVLRPLLQAGRCPNLRRLMDAGSFGRLATLDRTLSPVVWTSIATGKLPQEHGILDFLDSQGREFTSSRRAVRALWNIADRAGLSTNMFGWFVTWPVEPIRGVAVSGSSSAALIDENWKPTLLPGAESQVHPPELTAQVMALAEAAGARETVLALARDKVYGELPEGLLDERQLRIRKQTLWSIQSDATYHAVARRMLAERPADLNLVYFGGPDVVGHRYWRQYEPEVYAWREDPAADAALAGVIPRYYEWFDEMLGELIEAAGPDTTVLVVSDHGMHAVSTEAPNELGTTGHHLDGTPGVIVAAGPGIVQQGDVEYFLRTGGLPTHGSVVDVAPTVLALLGIPAGRDMAGRAYRPMLAPGPALDAALTLPLVETHDAGFRPPAVVAMPAAMSTNLREKFGQLGYTLVAPDDTDAHVVMPPEDREPPDADMSGAPQHGGSDGEGADGR
jgi:hypothetical protein